MSEPQEKVFLAYAKESSVFGMCACGKSFGPYFGVDANEKHAQFMREHDCDLLKIDGTVTVYHCQRIGDETV